MTEIENEADTTTNRESASRDAVVVAKANSNDHFAKSDVIGGVEEMECDDVNAAATATYMPVGDYGNVDQWMPSENLVFTVEQDGYCFYEDTMNGMQYSMDGAGFWYVWDETQGAFVSVDEPAAVTSNVNNQPINSNVVEKDAEISLFKREIAGIKFDEDGFPVFPTNAKGQPILPKDGNDQPFFPVDEHDQPVFPYNRVTRKWTFPMDDTEEPIFPRNSLNKPIVPVDDDGKPIFPRDERGEFIFPLDESHCPIPALTPSGCAVIPTDEFGVMVIPRDREGRHLIHIAADGVTPLSLAEFRQWKQSCRQSAKQNAINEMHLQQQPHPAVVVTSEAPVSIFHPLNIQQFTATNTDDIAMLQRSKRVRPEDIDLPMIAPFIENSSGEPVEVAGNGENGTAAFGAATVDTTTKSDITKEEEERARKRKKMLSAQLHFSKRVPLKLKQQQPSAQEKPSDTSLPTESESDVSNIDKYSEPQKNVVQPPIDTVQQPLGNSKTADSDDMSIASRSHTPATPETYPYDTEEAGYDSYLKKTVKDYWHDDRVTSPERSEQSSSSSQSGKKRRFIQHSFSSRTRPRGGSHSSEGKRSKSFHRKDDKKSKTKHQKKKTHDDDLRSNSDRSTPKLESIGKKRWEHSEDESEVGQIPRKKGRLDDINNRRFADGDKINIDDRERRRSESPVPSEVAQLNQFSDLKVVQQFMKRHERRYNDIKKKIKDSEIEKDYEKKVLRRLHHVEKLVKKRLSNEIDGGGS